MTLFEKIAAGEIPADIIHEDDFCLCFRDISPEAPVHLLLVPRKPIPRLSATTADDAALLGHMLSQIPAIATAEGIQETGFRTVINSGPQAGETVPHLHIHILGGRQLTWPPG